MKTAWMSGVLCWLALLACACPAEDVFPIMSWDLPTWSEQLFAEPHHGLDSLAECGFTVAGFVRPRHLKHCEKLGLKAIVSPAKWQVEWRKLSDAQIEKAVRDLIKESGDSPALMGYFLTDEPGTPDFAALGKAVAA